MAIFELARSVRHYSGAIHRIISFCESPREAADIIAEASTYPEFSSYVNTPTEVFEWIVEAGGLVNIPETTQFEATGEGREFLKEYSPELLFEKFMDKESEHAGLIGEILAACAKPVGMGELEERYKGHPAMTPGKLSVSYFVDELEKAGALVWQDGWVVTEAGRGFVKSL